MSSFARLTPPGEAIRRGLTKVAAPIGVGVAAFEVERVWFFDPVGPLGSPDLLALLLSAGASALVTIIALAREGTLSERLMTLLGGLLAIYALLIATGMALPVRLPPPLLLTSALLSLVSGLAAIHLRHLCRESMVAAVVADPRSQFLAHLGPNTRFVTDPTTDPAGLDVLIVDRAALADETWARFVARAALAGCEVRSVGSYVAQQKGRVLLDYAEPDARRMVERHLYPAVKRVIDIAMVLLTAPAALALVGMAAITVRIAMGRPILFVQDRVGLHGRVFRIYKLRTMRIRAANEPQIATARHDDRITALGRALRRYHIDELPQLWNVLRGDMSLIGPRPEQPQLASCYSERLPCYALRHCVRPGISGWSQVRFGYAETLEETREKLEFDLFYVQNYGPVLDAQIVGRTIAVMLDRNHVR